ncbi:hypothetical protein SXANM310S_07303 [Streptomyces xanthochromogenes]
MSETKNAANGNTGNTLRTGTPSAGPGLDISRRKLLGTVGAVGVGGLALGAAGGAAAYAAVEGPDDTSPLASVGSTEVMFHGKHQAGITTPLQSTGHLIAFDLAPGAGRKEAAALMRRWSTTARALMAGEPSGSADTGVALDAGPSSLTVTFGFGHSFFDRTQLTDRRPAQLDPLPDFSSDQLDARRSNGDLWVQIGADDALVAFHALRAIQHDAGAAATVRWQMNGFNRTPGATAKPMTARNLMGQIDGTNNPKPADPDFDERVFVPDTAQPAWMAGGSYAVVRRIRMLLDSFRNDLFRSPTDAPHSLWISLRRRALLWTSPVHGKGVGQRRSGKRPFPGNSADFLDARRPALREFHRQVSQFGQSGQSDTRIVGAPDIPVGRRECTPVAWRGD